MKNIAVFLFAVLLILSVNGNATEKEIINLVSYDNSLSVEKINHIEIKTSSNPELDQGMSAVLEPIALLILGFALIGIGLIGRKTLLKRCPTCPRT